MRRISPVSLVLLALLCGACRPQASQQAAGGTLQPERYIPPAALNVAS